MVLSHGVDEFVGGGERRAALRPIGAIDEADEENVLLLPRLQLDVAEDAVEVVDLLLQLNRERLGVGVEGERQGEECR